jgi:hypothetical protein
MEMDSVTGSIYLGDPGVDRDHHIISNTHSIFPGYWSHAHLANLDALGGRDHASLEMHLDAVIVRAWRCTWRSWLCELGGRDRARVEIHLEAMVERVRRYTRRPSPCEFGDALGGCNHTSIEMHLEAVIVRILRCTWRSWLSEIGGVLRCV